MHVEIEHRDPVQPVVVQRMFGGDGAGGAEFRRVWQAILARTEAIAPELILVSAGFDAHADDPLASLALREEDFAWVSHEICTLAGRICAGRVVSCLEGGYDLPALGASAAAHVKVLKEHGDGR